MPALVAFVSLLLLALSGSAGPAADDLEATVEAFLDRWFEFHPTAAAGAGLHEYDGRVGRRDAASIGAWLADLAALEERFAALDPEALDDDGRLDRDLVLHRIRAERFWLEEVGTWRRDPRFYASQWDLSLLLLLDYAPFTERARSIVRRLERYPDLVAAARENVADPPWPFVETALITYRGWPPFLRGEVTDAFADVDPGLRARFEAARDAAIEAIEAYTGHLESVVLPRASGGYALGAERFRRMNALLAGVDLPIPRLKAIGEAELARLEDLALELARKIVGDAAGEDAEATLAAALDSLAADTPAPGAIVATATGQIERLKRFASEMGTVLPGDVEVREIPPFARTNFAYIWIPGPFEAKTRTGLYFIHPVEEEWSAEETAEFLARNHRWSILNTSGHETYPGHYHHYNHVHRAPTRIQRLLTVYVTTEGWAHYAEETAWRSGLADGDPKLGLAMVQDALLRVVRFLASIGLHTEGMSVDEAETMFRTLARQDPVNARQQALRGTYDPEYLNYTLGKLMIERLRADAAAAAAERGETFDRRAFHDAFMVRGAPPVPWIGRRLLGDPRWRAFREAAGGVR